LIAAKRNAGIRILDLTESNPTRAGLHYPPEIVSAFHDPRMLVYEPAPAGLPEVREEVAAYYAVRGLSVEPERILLNASTS
jgi:aspartate/methionine/tyrosine aminotransferase